MAKANGAVEDIESIARYVFFSDEVRADGTPRPKLYEPDRQHECSLASQSDRAGPPDTAAGTGHNGAFALKSLHIQ